MMDTWLGLPIEGWVAIATIALVVVTGLLALGTFLLWRATQAHVDEAERAAQSQLRAYVFPTKPEFELREDHSTRFNVGAKNFGATPAFNMSMIMKASAAAPDLPPDFAAPFSPKYVSLMSLGPGQEVRNEQLGTGTPQSSKELEEGLIDLHLWGKITYQSMGKDYVTNFRLSALKDGIGKWVWSTAPEGNDAT
jgi:hypothetical protein